MDNLSHELLHELSSPNVNTNKSRRVNIVDYFITTSILVPLYLKVGPMSGLPNMILPRIRDNLTLISNPRRSIIDSK